MCFHEVCSGQTVNVVELVCEYLSLEFANEMQIQRSLGCYQRTENPNKIDGIVFFKSNLILFFQ
jgi:hypothetical protein